MNDEALGPDGARSTVDVTIDAATMLRVRDRYRAQLVQRYHLLQIAARAQRRTGNLEGARRHAADARHALIMLWSLDNPMETLTVLRKGAEES